MRGFNSAQRSYENMEPAYYAEECYCEELHACENCDYMATEGGDCPECEPEENDGEVFKMEPVERTEHYEGILTDSGCDIHNHVCRTRDCCD